MGIFDRFKKPQKQEKKEAIKKPPVRVEKKIEKKIVEPKIEKPKTTRKVIKKEYSDAYRILRSPMVTEKSTDLNELNQYVFKVWPRSNKNEIKNSVQDLYGVRVESVNIIKVPGKKRRLGRHTGWHSGYKKAIVKLAQGEKIEVIAR